MCAGALIVKSPNIHDAVFDIREDHFIFALSFSPSADVTQPTQIWYCTWNNPRFSRRKILWQFVMALIKIKSSLWFDIGWRATGASGNGEAEHYGVSQKQLQTQSYFHAAQSTGKKLDYMQFRRGPRHQQWTLLEYTEGQLQSYKKCNTWGLISWTL